MFDASHLKFIISVKFLLHSAFKEITFLFLLESCRKFHAFVTLCLVVL